MELSRLLDPLERMTALDAVVTPLQRLVRAALPPGRVRDALHGVWLGHPMHPALVQVPIGAWMSAVLLDRLPGTTRLSRTLIGVGVVAAVPSVVAGATDWSELHEQQMRVGLVHAASNAAAVGLFAFSWGARRRGLAGQGHRTALAGLAVAGAGGYLGGHLAYHQAAGANHAEEVPHLVQPGWRPAGTATDVQEGESTRRVVDGVPVLLTRVDGRLYALAERCSHLSGPLAEGTLKRLDGRWCVECPWHGSTFAITDGAVVHGPATAPQPAFEVREVDGTVQVCLPGAG